MPKPPPPRIHIQYPQPAVDAGALSRQAHRGRSRRGHAATSSATATRSSARWSSPGPPAPASGPSTSCTRSTPTTTASAGAGASSSTSSAAGSSPSAPGPTSSAPGATSCGASSRPARPSWPASSPRASSCSQDAATRAKGADEKLIEHALRVLDDPEILEAAKHDAAMGHELFAAVERNAERHGYAELAPALELEVDRERARFGAWYEVFPRSWGGLKGVEAQVPALAELGFDVVYLTPIHPIGRTNRKGRNNTLVAGPDDPGSPYAVGAAEGGHDAVHPDIGTVEDVRRAVRDRRRARHGRLPGLRHQRVGRPPLAHRPPRVVPPPPRRHAEVRREPAQEVPGHLQRQLGVRGLARPVGGVAPDLPVLGRAGRQGLPRRQPAHEADRRSGSG